jgi:capsular polysaccharide export protein
MASMRGLRTHVLEEGYLRPDWMTFEPEGVNARSTLSRDKNWFLTEALRLPPEPGLSPVTSAFQRRARDSYWHYHHVVTGLLRYPYYQSHRSGSIIIEGLGWLWKFYRERQRSRRAQEVLRFLEGRPMFLFPLQLSGDYQIRAHSPFPDMQSAANYVFESFAAHAPFETHLLVKRHPMDCSFFGWQRFVQQQSKRLGLGGRLHFIDGGHLDDMVGRSRGLICVNSTSATLALAQGVPVCTVGEAIYDIAGLTHQDHVDTFWKDPRPPESLVYSAFRRVLVERCLVRGGLSSESAVQTLIKSMLDRLGRSAESSQPALDQLEMAVPVRLVE